LICESNTALSKRALSVLEEEIAGNSSICESNIALSKGVLLVLEDEIAGDSAICESKSNRALSNTALSVLEEEIVGNSAICELKSNRALSNRALSVFEEKIVGDCCKTKGVPLLLEEDIARDCVIYESKRAPLNPKMVADSVDGDNVEHGFCDTAFESTGFVTPIVDPTNSTIEAHPKCSEVGSDLDQRGLTKGVGELTVEDATICVGGGAAPSNVVPSNVAPLTKGKMKVCSKLLFMLLK
jgi:hypothetical protein